MHFIVHRLLYSNTNKLLGVEYTLIVVIGITGGSLKRPVHRLPVINTQEEVVGIVTRVDVFEPLMPKSEEGDPLYRIMSKPEYFGHDFKSD
eukprot:1196409-Prorocentrum_minimum.AAC.4